MPRAHLTAWIGLDDATTENGCLWYVPGSHRWGLLPMTGLGGDMDNVTVSFEAADAGVSLLTADGFSLALCIA